MSLDGALITAKPKSPGAPASTPEPSHAAVPCGPSSSNFCDPPAPATATPAVIPATTNVASSSLKPLTMFLPPLGCLGRAGTRPRSAATVGDRRRRCLVSIGARSGAVWSGILRRTSRVRLFEPMERKRNMDELQQEIQELFSDLWQVPRFSGLRAGFRPHVDCFRTDDALTVVVEIPGI